MTPKGLTELADTLKARAREVDFLTQSLRRITSSRGSNEDWAARDAAEFLLTNLKAAERDARHLARAMKDQDEKLFKEVAEMYPEAAR